MLDILKVKAVLTKTIDYTKEGEQIQHLCGTTIEVDPDQGIGLYGDDHFELTRDEYKIVYMN